ncbi:Uncharacterised protein [Zhongshania aliphaticivorans]|uniref:Uncharacterized protein n=1 Tax=Zhongshania aliphaticivorans TaxID=1470434 RepID=A0A5S9MUD2_9GAMM|nr:hypothetical protein [Zhongshania aliphaticivorans]CAA0079903.1 Uncharacterised protein [Zhongshania aliphaticivorans]CAA0085935.1 Uncharacterised protein [Zhongshania aliphaticivorans]
MIDHNDTPIWAFEHLIFISSTPIIYIGSWKEKLNVMYPDNNGNFHNKHLYDYVGISLRWNKNNCASTNSWLETIPKEIRDIFSIYPSNQFYLARVAAMEPISLDLARRNFIFFVIWLEHCRRNNLRPERMLYYIREGEYTILKKLGVQRVDQALFSCKRIENNVVSAIPPEYILKCLLNDACLNFLSQTKQIKTYHFTRLSTDSYLSH